MTAKKIKPKHLISFNFKFYGLTPTIFQVDENGKQISGSHMEVSKIREDGSRIFETKIFRPGIYKYRFLNVPETRPYYYEFKTKREGYFLLSESGQLTFQDNYHFNLAI